MNMTTFDGATYNGVSFLAATGPATSLSVTGATTGLVGSPSSFTFAPNGTSTGTVTPTMSGLAGSWSPATLTFSGSANSQSSQFTPSVAGTGTPSATASGLTVTPGSSFVASVPVVNVTIHDVTTRGPSFSGLVGTISQSWQDADSGATVLADTTSGITELVPGSYRCDFTAAQPGHSFICITNDHGASSTPFDVSLPIVVPAASTGGGGGTGITLEQLQDTLASGIAVLAPSGLDQVQVEPGINARQALSPIAAFSGGLLTGASDNGSTISIKALGAASNGPTRVTATTDILGNRTSVTLNLPD